MWFGTDAGLCKFDGKNIKVLTTADGLPGNSIWSITEDGQNNLWIACYGKGISMFNGKSFHNYSTTDGLVNNNVRKVYYSPRSNSLFVGTVNGFSCFRDSKFISFQDSSITKRNLLQVTSFIDSDSLVYLFTYYDTKRFIEFNPYAGRFSYLPSGHRFHYSKPYSTSTLVTSYGDTIIANYTTGIKIYNGSINKIDSLGQVFDMVEESNGNVLIASYSDGTVTTLVGKAGIYRLSGGKAKYISPELGINSEQCWCFFSDKDQNLIWIGTHDAGIYICPNTGTGYLKASCFDSQRPVITDLAIDETGDIWVAAGSKVIRYEKVSDIPDHPVRIYNSADFSSPVSRKAGDNADDDKIKFSTGNDQTMWVRYGSGVFSIKGNHDPILRFLNPLKGMQFFVTGDTLLTSLLQSQIVLHSKTELLSDIMLRKTITYSYFNKYVRDNNDIWIYNNSEGIIKNGGERPVFYKYLSEKYDHSITSLASLNNNTLIAGTSTGYLYRFSTEKDSLKLTGQILPGPNVKGTEIKWILPDKNDMLWFMTNTGLHVISGKAFSENEIPEDRLFNEENGIPFINSNKALMADNESIVLMSSDQLTIINTEQLIRSVKKSLNPEIARIDINYKENNYPEGMALDRWKNIPSADLRLPFDMNTVGFMFKLNEYAEPGKVRYSYMLENGQEIWSNFSAHPWAQFNSLRPGEYNLKVKVMLQSDPQNIGFSDFRFSILPPWYRTWWFLAFAFLLIVSAVAIAITGRIKRLKSKAEMMRKMEILRLEALKSQMNPHFIFNSFNSLQKYILEKDTKSALNYVSDLSSLIRKTLDCSTKDKISLNEEILYLKTYIDLERRRLNNFEYSILVDQAIDAESVMIPPMLIQPAIENSILHGLRHLQSDGILKIFFRLDILTGKIMCIVEDNGVGREKSMEIYRKQNRVHNSRGSDIIKERAHIYGATFTITDLTESGSSAGTRAVFIF